MSFAKPGDDDSEKWLQDHNKQFSQKTPKIEGSGNEWKSPRGLRERRKRNKRAQARQTVRPLHVGKIKQQCPHCKQEAPVELFRDTKCLACQAAEFLGPL